MKRNDIDDLTPYQKRKKNSTLKNTNKRAPKANDEDANLAVEEAKLKKKKTSSTKKTSKPKKVEEPAATNNEDKVEETALTNTKDEKSTPIVEDVEPIVDTGLESGLESEPKIE